MANEIVDIHVYDEEQNARAMRDNVVRGLQKPAGHKTLPTMLLYDERGLRLYDEMTTRAPEYYLFGAEEEILKDRADEIVRVMHRGVGDPEDEVVLELGAGALRKTSHVLRALAGLVETPQKRAPITYFALDLEQRELQRTLGQIAESKLGMELEGKVTTKGMWGTYEDGLKFVKSGGLDAERVSHAVVDRARYAVKKDEFDVRDHSPASAPSEDSEGRDVFSESYDISPPSTPEEHAPPLHLLFLGSSLGNFSRTEQADFLRALPLQPGSGDTLLIGLDHDNDKSLIEEAYNDRAGHTKAFIMNGLRAAGRVLADENLFAEEKWEYVNEYDEKTRRHAAYYKSKTAQTVRAPESGLEFKFLENELVKVEESLKFSEEDVYTLFTESNLRPVQRWTDNKSQYSLWLLERPPFQFPLLRSPRTQATNPYSTTPFGVPSPTDWRVLWAAWDTITLRMIPPSMLFQKPIDLRHICLFYLGHIPAFLDIHLSRLLGEPHTEPVAFKDIFERGIDPNVDDPTQCHPHSEVPTEEKDWPALSEILGFVGRVRERVLRLYEDIDGGRRVLDRRIGRVLFMTYEHEALHAETLLYMLLQRSGTGTLKPPGFAPPDWDSLTAKWDADAKREEEQGVEATVTLGPATVSLGHDDDEVEDLAGPGDSDVRSHEFGWDNEHPKRDAEVGAFRISWRPVTNGQFYAFYRSVPSEQKQKLEFPSSWVENGGEIFVRTLHGPVPMQVAQHWPIVTSYNNLSTYATVKGGRLPTEPELRLFHDKFESGYEGGANIGFRNWHPVPATTGGVVGEKGKRLGGRGSNGGVWEWTSTLFEKFEGFVPSKLYPGYSADFFDGAYQVVIGGSYATIPRIAERRSMRNWYQRNYPFPWVGGRVAYDV